MQCKPMFLGNIVFMINYSITILQLITKIKIEICTEL